MDYELLKEAFLDQQEKLDEYFDNELMAESRAKDFVEIHKRDLVNNLFLELFNIHDRETYMTYEPVPLIWIKAKKIWIDFVRRLDRETKRKGNVKAEHLPETFSFSSFENEFEARQLLEKIEELLTAEEIKLLEYRKKGFTYKQIHLLAPYPSPNAAKTEFHRIKIYLNQNFRRPDFKF